MLQNLMGQDTEAGSSARQSAYFGMDLMYMNREPIFLWHYIYVICLYDATQLTRVRIIVTEWYWKR